MQITITAKTIARALAHVEPSAKAIRPRRVGGQWIITITY